MVSLLPTKFHEILFSSFRGVALTSCFPQIYFWSSLSAQLLWNYWTEFHETWLVVRTPYVVMHITRKFWSPKFWGPRLQPVQPICKSGTACRKHFPVLSSFMTYHRYPIVFFYYNIMYYYDCDINGRHVKVKLDKTRHYIF
jgi:hypothetical protein